MPARECSRTACSRPAVSTLTYVYADQTAVLGPLSRQPEPHAYDLCRDHAERLTAPQGWDLVRIAGGAGEATDDLVALADALRSRRADGHGASPAVSTRSASSARTPHLHVLRSPRD